MTLPPTPEVADAVTRIALVLARWNRDEHSPTWAAQQALDAILADPVVSTGGDRITVSWPVDSAAAIVSRSVLDAIVARLNDRVGVRLVRGPGDEPQRLVVDWPDPWTDRALVDRHLFDQLVDDANALRTLRRILLGAR